MVYVCVDVCVDITVESHLTRYMYGNMTMASVKLLPTPFNTWLIPIHCREDSSLKRQLMPSYMFISIIVKQNPQKVLLVLYQFSG